MYIHWQSHWNEIIVNELSKKGYQIELHEADVRLGGVLESRLVRWILSRTCSKGNDREILQNYEIIGFFKKSERKEIYGGRLSVLWMFGKYLIENMTTYDMLRFTTAMYTFSQSDKRTVEQWLEDSALTHNAKLTVRKICLALASNAKEFLHTVSLTQYTRVSKQNLFKW